MAKPGEQTAPQPPYGKGNQNNGSRASRIKTQAGGHGKVPANRMPGSNAGRRV